MRHITVPAPIPINSGGEFTFADFVRSVTDRDPRFTGSASAVRLAIKIQDACDGKPTVVALEDAQWTALRDAALEPRVEYVVKPPRLLARMLDAIENAAEVEVR